MSGFTTPDGERFTIFGEGGGQLLADELDIPLLGKVPLSEPLREHADNGSPLVTAEPDSPASQAIRQAARGIVAATPQELPVLQAVPGDGRTAAGQRHPASRRPGLDGQRPNDSVSRGSRHMVEQAELPRRALELADPREAEAFVAGDRSRGLLDSR